MLFIMNEEEDCEEEPEEGTGENEPETVELKLMKVNGKTEIALRNIHGFTEKGTIKLRGRIKGREGQCLCQRVELKLPEITFKADFLAIDLGKLDVVLRLSWLCSIGFMEVHWPSKSIAFRMENRMVVTKRDSLLTTKECSLKQLTRMRDEEDQGFWVEFQNLGCEEDEEIEDEISKRGDEEGLPMIHALLKQYEDIFETTRKLPQKKAIDHRILKMEVKKKTGRHFYVDYRKLHQATIANKVSISVIEELLVELHGAAVFSNPGSNSATCNARRHGCAVKGADYASRQGSCYKRYTSYLCIVTSIEFVLSTSFPLACPSVSEARGFLGVSVEDGMEWNDHEIQTNLWTQMMEVKSQNGICFQTPFHVCLAVFATYALE
ncbi:pleiotropic drug resistance protein 1-like [Cucumis melo var. makuwa]|uniref:Pleiotropic drug resistance protein 1-like n=1 Tax=Cucumis melo var. makuwa TaxID=1194695 RepID=A0A5D3BUC1_CUCMM|nr:pleiotropic drug resistance protein 1-like [Cucumis melo var. makuwa]